MIEKLNSANESSSNPGASKNSDTGHDAKPETAQEQSPVLERGSTRFPGQALARVTAAGWRWSGDRRSVASFVGRWSAHLAIVALALLLGLVGRIALMPIDVVGFSEPRSISLSAAAQPAAAPASHDIGNQVAFELQLPKAVVRQANPLTMIPERVRLNVITYTVQDGDNVFWIAEQFKLSAYTIVWSNMETLQGSPWLLQPGLTLAILPVDGVYHVVMVGDTPESIAESYEVSADALYNSWNTIVQGYSLTEGTLLVIPDAIGADFVWVPPPPDPVAPAIGLASGSWGYCGDTAVSGYGANGWFILPTGSYGVSGWTFADPRNPGHIGLDYRCSLGDAIVAADAGVVVWAGWNGGYGNLVRVRHGNGYETYYAHFNAYAVSCGEPVYQGQILGYCGTTGWSSGPHLHYEIRYNGVPQNPRLFEP